MKTKLRKIAILADFPWSFFDKGATGRGDGHSATWLTQLAEELAKQSDYEIHWISINRSRGGRQVRQREWRGLNFCEIPAGKVMIDLALGYWPSRLRLMRELQRIQPALVHCWGTERCYPIVCGLLELPTILSMQGILSNLSCQGYLAKSWFWNRLAKLEPNFIRSASVVTCESQWAIERVKEVAAEAHTYQVEYGVSPSFFQIQWDPDLEKPYALFVGSLVTWKGIEVLLAALRMASGPIRFEFVGDGPFRDMIETCGIPGVKCHGTLPWNEVQRLMKKASCLVHPTLADSSPNVVKEARVIGLPVITTVYGGQAGYIRDGENGIIIDPLEPFTLATAIQRLLSNPAEALRMGATHHEQDRAYFRPARTAQGFLQIYNELLQNNKCPGSSAGNSSHL